MRAKILALPTACRKYVRVGESLYIESNTGIYYVRKSFKRYRIPALFQSTYETKVGKAKSKATELIKAHMDRYLGSDAHALAARSGKTVSSIIDEIMETVAPTKRKTTQENYRIYLGELRSEWGRMDISRITLATWQTWMREFRPRKKRKTYMDYAKYMNLVLRYAYQHKYTTHLLAIPNPDPIRESPARVFSQEEIRALWAAMNDDTRDQFVLCYECFMRLREALYLTWDRVDLDKGEITLRAQDVKTGSKTGKGRTFHVSPLAAQRLRARRKRVPGPFVFPSPTDPSKPMHQNKTAWNKAKRRAKITGKAKWHSLRHSAITHALLDAKAEPILVSEYAGVSMRTIQQVYLHSTSEKTRSVARSVSVFDKKGVNGV